MVHKITNCIHAKLQRIQKLGRTMTTARYEVIIIGGGPAGLTAGLYSHGQALKLANGARHSWRPDNKCHSGRELSWFSSGYLRCRARVTHASTGSQIWPRDNDC